MRAPRCVCAPLRRGTSDEDGSCECVRLDVHGCDPCKTVKATRVPSRAATLSTTIGKSVSGRPDRVPCRKCGVSRFLDARPLRGHGRNRLRILIVATVGGVVRA